jgi:hypothetical protein
MLDTEMERMTEEYNARRGSLDTLKGEIARLDGELSRLAEARGEPARASDRHRG